MNDDFKQKYLCTPYEDPEFEFAVQAWMAYHTAADAVDGHCLPGSFEQSKLTRYAISAGKTAMKDIDPNMQSLRNTKAKSEALRRLMKG